MILEILVNEFPPQPRGLRPQDVLELNITSLDPKGHGLARVKVAIGPQEEERHYMIQVPHALPGDRALVRLGKRRRRRFNGRVLELLTPSPHRIEARCRHFGLYDAKGRGCGGCSLQSLSYQQQIDFKREQVQNLMTEKGIDAALVQPVIKAQSQWEYRNKMEFSFGDDDQRNFALGMYPPGFKFEILPLKECWLESNFVSRILPLMHNWFQEKGLQHCDAQTDEGFLRNLTIREGKRTGERMIELTTSDAESARYEGEMLPAPQVAEYVKEMLLSLCISMGEALTSFYWTQKCIQKGSRTRLIEHHLHGAPTLRETLRLPEGQSLHFEIHPRAFFQPNTLQAEVLYQQVIEKSGLTIGGQARIVDLYCGTGTIALCLSPYAAQVVGIELSPEAIENARKNALANQVENVTFIVGDVGEVLGSELFKEEAGVVDMVIIDPPRAGLLPQALSHLLAIAPPQIVYVSCNPKTLARDLAALLKVGYQIEVIQPVDMFPNTWHIENVTLLKRISSEENHEAESEQTEV